jgi:hypothetical protein
MTLIPLSYDVWLSRTGHRANGQNASENGYLGPERGILTYVRLFGGRR